MAIHFFEEDIKVSLKNRRNLKSFLTQQIQSRFVVDTIDLTFVFCSDEALLARNIEFLNHDTLTDIITFDLSASEEDLTGEIYISVDRVRDNAKTFQTTFNHELHRVIFHGVLHLLGYKDKTKEEAAEMRKMEDTFLEAYFKQS